MDANNTDLDWPDDKPIGVALDDIEENGTVNVEITIDFLTHLFHMETHGFRRTDLEEKK